MADVRLIDVNAAIERAKESDKIVGYSIWETGEVVEFLEDCPIEDAAPVVHGRWEKHKTMHGFVYCSACRDVYLDAEWLADGKWTYCPNCGAKMDLEVPDGQA